MAIQRVTFPSFIGDDYPPYEMRQLVSALDLRFSALETAINQELFDTTGGTGDFSQVGHTHFESEITDLQPYLLNINNESIFDLNDVTGTPSNNDVLVYNSATMAFESVAPGAAAAVFLNDLVDVSVPAPSDGQILTYDTGSGQWQAETPSTALSTFFGLSDTDLTSQSQYDMVYNDDGTNWHDTDGQLQWNPLGPFLQLTNSAGINWLDISSTSVEMLTFFGDASTTSNNWGTSKNDWTYVGITHDQTALEATGICQLDAFGIDVLHVSPDGLHVIVGNGSGDFVRSYTLDSPYDFSNATSDGASDLVTNPWRTVQWINNGTQYMIQLSSSNDLQVFNSDSAFKIDGSVAPVQTQTNASLGFPTSGETVYWMSRDGTRLIGCGEVSGGDDYYRLFTLSTPYDITTFVFVQTIQMDNMTNGPIGHGYDFHFTEDGLTVIHMNNSDAWWGSLTVPFDLTTLTWDASNPLDIQSDTSQQAFRELHVAEDGNTLWMIRDTSTNPRIAEYTKTVQNPALVGETFFVGDPGYLTQIDGTTTTITGDADIDGTLNVDGTSQFNADVDIDGNVVSVAPMKLLGDIPTATPPTSEAITNQLQFWDSDETDQIGSVGYFGSSIMGFRNEMEGGQAQFEYTNGAGVLKDYLQANPGATTRLRAVTDVFIDVQDGEIGALFSAGGGFSFYFNNTLKLVGSTQGIDIHSASNADDQINIVRYSWLDGTDRAFTGFSSTDDFFIFQQTAAGDVIVDSSGSGSLLSNIDTQVRDGSTFSVFDGANTDSLAISLDGTDALILWTNVEVVRERQSITGMWEWQSNTATAMRLDNTADHLWLRDGYAFRISDAGDTEYIEHATASANHVTTQVNLDFWQIQSLPVDIQRASNEKALLLSGVTASATIPMMHVYDHGSALRRIMLFTEDLGETQTAGFYMDIDATLASPDNILYWGHTNATGTNNMLELHQNEGISIRANDFRIWDAGGTDNASFTHDGTDFITTFTGTADWQMFGLNSIILNSTFQMAEQAANNSPAAGYGEYWVRDDVPNVPMFTDDAGTDFNLLDVTGGASLTAPYRFDNSTTEADPGSGDFRMDNATPASVTELFISSTSDNGNDLNNIIGLLANGDRVYIQQDNDSSKFILFDVTANVDNTGWYSVAGTTASSGTLFDNNAKCHILLLFGGGGGGGGIGGSITDNQVAVGAAVANDIEGDSNLTWDGTELLIGIGGATQRKVMLDADATSLRSFIATKDIAGVERKILTRGDSDDLINAGNVNFDYRIFGLATIDFEAPLVIVQDELRIQDAGNTDFVSFSHDGTDFNIVGTNTTDINVTGITSLEAPAFNGVALTTAGVATNYLDETGAYSVPAGAIDISGTPVNNQVAIWTDANTLEGDADLTFTGTVLLVGTTGGAAIQPRVDPSTGFSIHTAVGVGGWARGLVVTKQSDGLRAAGAGFLGGGEAVTNFQVGFGADWFSTDGVLTVSPTQMTMEGNLLSLDNSALATETNILNYNSAGGVGITTALTTAAVRINQLSGAGAVEDVWIAFARNGGVQLYYNNVAQFSTGALGMSAQLPIYMLERAAAQTDAPSFGQWWVRNDATQTPMFTADDGTDFALNASGGGTVSGTGTDNFIAVWNGTADIDAGGSFNITNAVDKTAAETISGIWSFTAGTNAIRLFDNDQLALGTGPDMRLYWDGTDLKLFGVTIDSNFDYMSGTRLRLFASNDTDHVDFHHNGTNLQITGTLTSNIEIVSGITTLDLNSTNLLLNDNANILFGSSGDIDMTFTGSVFVTDHSGNNLTWTDAAVVSMTHEPGVRLAINNGARFRAQNPADNGWTEIWQDATKGNIQSSTAGGLTIHEYNVASTVGALSTNTEVFDYTLTNVHEIDIEAATGNVTFTLSGGPPSGDYGTMEIKVTQDGTAARTITWAGGTFRWAGGTAHPLTSTLNGFTIYVFETWDGGTIWYGAGADYS